MPHIVDAVKYWPRRTASRTFPVLPANSHVHETQSPADHGFLGRVDGMDARRHGLGDLRAGPYSRAHRADSEIRNAADTRAARLRRLGDVRPVSRRLGMRLHLG